MTVEETLLIAVEAHAGQKDLDGKPVILHPLAVGLMGQDEIQIKTGFLHDVAEDTSVSLDDMRDRGVDEDVLAALQLLTHEKGADYFEYVRRIAASGNRTAIQVKINDLRNNLRRGRLSLELAERAGDAAKAARLVAIGAKHRKALEIFGLRNDEASGRAI